MTHFKTGWKFSKKQQKFIFSLTDKSTRLLRVILSLLKNFSKFQKQTNVEVMQQHSQRFGDAFIIGWSLPIGRLVV